MLSGLATLVSFLFVLTLPNLFEEEGPRARHTLRRYPAPPVPATCEYLAGVPERFEVNPEPCAGGPNYATPVFPR